jgi:hypothetical protein
MYCHRNANPAEGWFGIKIELPLIIIKLKRKLKNTSTVTKEPFVIIG